MRYVTVFTLFTIPVARGFAVMQDALECLRTAHEDPDLSPLGIYDATLEVVIAHNYSSYGLTEVDENLVKQIAKSYFERIV